MTNDRGGRSKSFDGLERTSYAVGSWDLRPAYESILERLPTFDIIGLPAIDIYRTTRVGARDGLARVAIAIPVVTRGLMVGAR